MDELIFQDKDPDLRRQIIRDAADKKMSHTYEKPFSNQDIAHFEQKLAEIIIKVRRMEEKLSEVRKEHNVLMKPYKEEITKLAEYIEFRSCEIQGEVFLFYDYEENKVGYYDEEGTLVYERPLQFDEAQKTIMSAQRDNGHFDEVEEIK
jgi:hypothetical protein